MRDAHYKISIINLKKKFVINWLTKDVANWISNN